MKYVAPLMAFACILISACQDLATGPALGSDTTIQLHVTGGFAGVDYTILVDAEKKVIIGEECISGCDFAANETLHGLTTDQATYLTTLFVDAGIHSLDGTNYGVECCDQFHYVVDYEDRDGTSTVEGSSELFSHDLLQAIQVVAGFSSGVFPIAVDPNADPDLWPRDPALFSELEIVGDKLLLTVEYSGGCSVHHFDMVAHGGWMESHPIQVGAFLSHDMNGDHCDALVTRSLAFDLLPLKLAYQDAYGVDDVGTTSLVISLDTWGTAMSVEHTPLVYVF